MVNKNKEQKFHCLEYIPTLSDQLKKDFKIISNINICFKPLNTLRKIFTNTKTKIQEKKCGYCYKIKCLGNEDENCNYMYIGESSREADNKIFKTLGPRTKEHIREYKKEILLRKEELNERDEVYKKFRTRNKIKELEKLKDYYDEIDKNKNYKTALLRHAIIANHKFDFNNVENLTWEKNWKKRKMKESLYIYGNLENCCNYKVDTKYVSNTSKRIIDFYNFKNKGNH